MPNSTDFGPDKLLHLIAYTGLAFLPPLFLKEKRLVFRCVLFLILWGILMEGAQAMVPNRSPSFWDLVANTAGVALGTWLGMRAGNRLHRPRSS